MIGGIQRESARYRIPALTTYADVDELGHNFRQAGDGAQLVYAIGPALGRNPIVEYARRLYEEGKAELCRKRDGNGYRYFIQKKAQRKGAGIGPAVRLGECEARLLDILKGYADRVAPLPSLEVLAESAGLSTRNTAHYRLNLLMKRGLVQLRCEGGERFVVIADESTPTP